MHCMGKMERFQRGDAARRQWPQVAPEMPAIARKLQMPRSVENCFLQSYRRLVSRRNPHFFVKMQTAAICHMQMC